MAISVVTRMTPRRRHPALPEIRYDGGVGRLGVRMPWSNSPQKNSNPHSGQVPRIGQEAVQPLIWPVKSYKHFGHSRPVAGMPHPTRSCLSSRLISRPIARIGSTPSNSTACTAAVMGISTRYFFARSMTDLVVATPSTTNGDSRR